MAHRDSLSLAFVLHRRDHGNTSLLVEVFASGRGRFPAIAKGARRKQSAMSALLQPFQPLWVAAVGRGEVLTLSKVEAAGSPRELAPRALVGGFYLNELLVRLLGRDDSHDALFAFYQSALSGLAEGEDLEAVLRRFELRLLEELGYGMTLDRVALDAAPVQPHLSYVYDDAAGLRVAERSDHEAALSGATLLALVSGTPLTAPQRREARLLLRRAMAPHLGGRPLQSRELYRRWFGGDG